MFFALDHAWARNKEQRSGTHLNIADLERNAHSNSLRESMSLQDMRRSDIRRSLADEQLTGYFFSLDMPNPGK
jgi:hypothetical protein